MRAGYVAAMGQVIERYYAATTPEARDVALRWHGMLAWGRASRREFCLNLVLRIVHHLEI